MRPIDTEIKPVVVVIEDKEYAVTMKTVEAAERLQKAEKAAVDGKQAQFELWKAQLEILLGRPAVRDLFPGGKAENLDRMEAIYYGVMDAFDYNGREAREARAEASTADVKAMAEALKPLADLLTLVNGAPDQKYPTIKRP